LNACGGAICAFTLIARVKKKEKKEIDTSWFLNIIY
jgi:hypothetical protein